MAKEEITIPRNEETLEDLDYVADCLKNARAYGLENEVVTWALKFSQQYVDLSVKEAMDLAMEEWDL